MMNCRSCNFLTIQIKFIFIQFQTDLLGQSVLNIIHPDDKDKMKRTIVPTDINTLLDITSGLADGEESRPRTKEEEDKIIDTLAKDKRKFQIRYATFLNYFGHRILIIYIYVILIVLLELDPDQKIKHMKQLN